MLWQDAVHAASGRASAPVRDLVGGDAGAIALFPDRPQAIGDLREPLADFVDIARLTIDAAEIFQRDRDDPAGVDDIVGRVEDAAIRKETAMTFLRELIVGPAGHDRAIEPGDALLVEDRAERVGAEHVA